MIGVFFFTLTSCEKDFDDTSIKQKSKGFKILSYSNSGANARGIMNNILSFESEDEFNATVDSLEQAFDIYQLDFQKKYFDTSDKELNDIIDTQNIDLEKPLTDFENFYNFHSLRNEINKKEEIWLSQSDPIFEECPQIFPIEDHVERTLWNEKGEIMIAGKIYKYENDRYIKIDDGDFGKLALINSGNQTVFNDEDVFVKNLSEENFSSTSDYTCKRNNNKSATKIVNGLSTIKLICSNRIKSKSWEFGKHKMSANSYSYIKISDDFSWRKYVCTIQVSMNGFKYFGCSTPLAVNVAKERRSNNIGVSHKRDNAFSVKYLNNIGSMKSSHAAISTPGIPSAEFSNLSF